MVFQGISLDNYIVILSKNIHRKKTKKYKKYFLFHLLSRIVDSYKYTKSLRILIDFVELTFRNFFYVF